jgi:hypothetical protein
VTANNNIITPQMSIVTLKCSLLVIARLPSEKGPITYVTKVDR